MTVSNLRGIPFTVSFGNSTYGMQTHGDRVHYTISGLGNGVSTKNAWVCADTSEPLAISTLPPLGEKKLPDTWDRYGTCALASSAFPIGLAPREIAAPISGYKKRSYPMARGAAALEPDFPKPWLAALGPKGFVFLNVDGGVINNNPFDYAQYALMGDSAAGKTGADDSDRAVISALFPALIDQSRFKPAELVPAMDPKDHSRFLIAPHRNIGGVEQRYKIACGLLGGFGGFLDEKFRAHDFQLGRRNCQAFLRSTFGLSADSDIVASLRGQNEFELSATPGKYAIIPRLGDALPEVALPEWPRMSQADFTVLMRRIKGRLSKLAPRFVQAQTASRFFRTLGRIGLWLGQDRVLEYVRLAILSDLVRRDQIEGWSCLRCRENPLTTCAWC